MIIRAFRPEDHPAVWEIIEPIIQAGETYALPRDTSEADAMAHWTGIDRETFVVEEGSGGTRRLIGTYYLKANQLGGGAHVANCGYMTAQSATGRGVAGAMCAHSLERAGALGFLAMQFNFVVSTNTRAVRLWQSFGFEIVGRLPNAFLHPQAGYIDAFVMFRTLRPLDEEIGG